MKITIIGCGNAFSKHNFNQSFLLEENGRTMLIDCGFQTPSALMHHGIKLSQIDDIYISHAHADHIGGLEEVAFTRYDWKNHPRHYTDGKYAPRLIANEQLLKDLWDKSLRGGLESMEGFVASIETYFEPYPVAPNTPLSWQGWNMDLVQQVHIMSGSIITNSFGLLISKEGHKTLYLTTDSQYDSPKQIRVLYEKADIIIQDCEITGVDTSKKAYIFGSGVHANYAELAGYPSANATVLKPEIKARMWLSHYQDFYLDHLDQFGNFVEWDKLAEADGFAGFLQAGQVFEI